MRRILYLLIFCVAVTVILVYQSQAENISSLDLINNAKQYDGKTITYRGEAVGEIMARGEHAWVNLNDGVNAIGIWVDKSAAGDIHHIGDYRAKGDTVEVTGVFHRSCPEHGGDLDIHAQVMSVAEVGKPLFTPIDFSKVYLGILLSCIVFITYLTRRIFIVQSRKKIKS